MTQKLNHQNYLLSESNYVSPLKSLSSASASKKSLSSIDKYFDLTNYSKFNKNLSEVNKDISLLSLKKRYVIKKITKLFFYFIKLKFNILFFIN